MYNKQTNNTASLTTLTARYIYQRNYIGPIITSAGNDFELLSILFNLYDTTLLFFLRFFFANYIYETNLNYSNNSGA